MEKKKQCAWKESELHMIWKKHLFVFCLFVCFFVYILFIVAPCNSGHRGTHDWMILNRIINSKGLERM
jgi:hypothetical protein